VQLGDVASWVGGIATAVALLFTYFLLRITRKEQMAQRAEQRQAQARLVSAWCDHIEPISGSQSHAVTVTLQNSSHEPIYGVRVAVGGGWSRDGSERRELDLPYVIPPNYRREHTVPLLLAPESGDGKFPPPVELIFSDAAGGRFWGRDRYGRLTQLKETQSSAAAQHFFRPPASPA
jgi:hypothetical protein